MEREAAQKLVDTVTIKINQYSAVSAEDCYKLLDLYTFNRLCNDPIRRLGPVPNTFYPWNVVDALSGAYKDEEMR